MSKKDLALHELPDYPALQQLGRALWRNGSTRGAAILVGAGFSKNAVVAGEDTFRPPLWWDLNKGLVAELYPGTEDAAPTNALRIAEEYRTYFGQAALDDFIRKRFPDRAWNPGALHMALLGLPWSDVLTTNWDTLLEKAASESLDHTYEVVHSESDLPHARAPRIVKLHGTIGDPGPLIFAEEDYRSYPSKHAAFVNLARQIFIENELCLIGFSGDDPNFLEWTGWVRDQLGGKARRIYLVGCLGLRPAKRKYLESLNIAPIDLEPAVSSLETLQRHAVATELFFDALARAKPRPQHEWDRESNSQYPLNSKGSGTEDPHQRARKDNVFAAEALEKTAAILENDRKKYPGWLVCPARLRNKLKFVNDEAFLLRPETLKLFDVAKRAQILFEFAWRRRVAFHPLGAKLRKEMFNILELEGPNLDGQHRLEFVTALMRDLRLTEDAPTSEQIRSLEALVGPLDELARLEIAYQYCLLARDRLDLPALLTKLGQLTTDDPVWKLRLAALWSEVGHHSVSTRLIIEANSQLDELHRLERNSLWIKSRLGWANTFCRMKDAASFNKRDEVKARAFKELLIDPSDEIDQIRKSAQEIQAKRYESAAITPLFNPGHYRESPRPNNGEVDESSYLSRFELDQLVEFAGAPARLNRVDFVANVMVSTAKVTYAETYDWYVFLMRGLHSHLDKAFEKYFGRIAIARLSNEVSQGLIAVVRSCIGFWISRRKESHGDDRKEDLNFATDRLRLYAMVLSRLTVRMSPDDAASTYRYALELVGDSSFSHHWLREAFGDLGRQAVAAISPRLRGRFALDAILFPLSGERNAQTQLWPNPTTWLWNIKPNRSASEPQWGVRIAQLISACAIGHGSREEAVVRLAYLSVEEVLTSAEEASFANALWSSTDEGEYALPLNSGLLDSTFLELPAPPGLDIKKRVEHRLFGQDLLALLPSDSAPEVLYSASCQSHLLSLRNSPKLGMKVEANRAAELFDQIVSWIPPKAKDNEDFFSGMSNLPEIVSLVGDVLGQVVVPALALSAMTESRLDAYFAFISKSVAKSGLSGLIYFIEAHPSCLDLVARAVEDGLTIANHFPVTNAALAIMTWAEVGETRAIQRLPDAVIDKLIMLVAARFEHGLAVLTLAATRLEARRLLVEKSQLDLITALSILFLETKYDGIDIESRKAVSNSLTRAECVKLAAALRANGRTEQILTDWILESEGDPLPEVRFCREIPDDFEV
jgi:hypothetical protein